MKGSVPLGAVFGIPLRMHATFLLLLAWFGWVGWSTDGWSSSLWAVALMISLFACVVMHELGHSLVARRLGVTVHSITLLPIGGVAALSRIPERPVHELLIAVAGPLVNVVIVAVLLVWQGGLPGGWDQAVFPTNFTALADSLMLANLVMILFNLIPAFPMDGGRIFRSGLAMFLPYTRATAVAAFVGQSIALLFLVAGAVFVRPILALIGVFVFLGAGSEDMAVQTRARLRRLAAADVMDRNVAFLDPDDAVERCLHLAHEGYRQDFPVLKNGLLVGMLPRPLWLAALREYGIGKKVGDIMEKRMAPLHLQSELSRLYRNMAMRRMAAYPVLGDDGVVGVITAEDIERHLMAEQQGTPRTAAASVTAPPSRSMSRWTVDLG